MSWYKREAHDMDADIMNGRSKLGPISGALALCVVATACSEGTLEVHEAPDPVGDVPQDSPMLPHAQGRGEVGLEQSEVASLAGEARGGDAASTIVEQNLDTNSQLQLPWPCGTSYRVTQGHNSKFSHLPGTKGAWAWDFGIPVGGQLVAPADGTVRLVKDGSTRHGCSSAYANDANYVTVDLGDGTEALFLHLRAGSIQVQPGQRVQAGQVIGEVGDSGWVCGSHLHFQIQRVCNSWWCQSVPATFAGIGDPGYNQVVTSRNCPGESGPGDDGAVEPPPAPAPAGCHSSTMGRTVEHGACVQMSYASCGGTCQWASCDDGAWQCAETSSCQGSHPHAACQ